MAAVLLSLRRSPPLDSLFGGATGDAYGASQPVAKPTMLESEHMTDEATYFRAGMKIITYA